VVARPVVTPPQAVSPTVTSLLRFGFHAQPTVLVLRFSTPLNALRAEDVRNYAIVTLGGSGRGGSRAGHRIGVSLAVYDAATRTVTLYPSERLDVHNLYALTVRGTGARGLTGVTGRPLSGQGAGRPSTDYVARITRQLLEGPASLAAALVNRQRAAALVSAPAVDVLWSLGKLRVKPAQASAVPDPITHFFATSAGRRVAVGVRRPLPLP